MAHARARPPTEWSTPALILGSAIVLEVVLVVGYFLATPATVSTPRYDAGVTPHS